MKVVVPYRAGMLRRSTYEAALAWRGGSEFYELSNPGEPVDASRYKPIYPHLMADLWARGESMLFLEHDVLPHEHSFEEMAACPEPWCAYDYGGGSGGAVNAVHAALGCCKITWEVIAATPDCFRTWGTKEDQGGTPWGWGYCDARMSWSVFEATKGRIRPHQHHPSVQHRTGAARLTVDECTALSRGIERPQAIPIARAPAPSEPLTLDELVTYLNRPSEVSRTYMQEIRNVSCAAPTPRRAELDHARELARRFGLS